MRSTMTMDDVKHRFHCGINMVINPIFKCLVKPAYSEYNFRGNVTLLKPLKQSHAERFVAYHNYTFYHTGDRIHSGDRIQRLLDQYNISQV